MKQQAALCYIERDGKILCVFNYRYKTWSLPGGKVEENEEPAQAAVRELKEETDLDASEPEMMYAGPSEHDFTWTIFVYKVQWSGEAKAMEGGCPIEWMTPQELIAKSFFAPFFKHFFPA